MPAITALVHTCNAALRLGRCLETVYPCHQVIVVDHGSSDETVAVARDYGAQLVRASQEIIPVRLRQTIGSGWILCLDPRESLSEGLAASLYELSLEPQLTTSGVYSVRVREETMNGWQEKPNETRLVRADWERWTDRFPATEATAPLLEGALLRFAFP